MTDQAPEVGGAEPDPLAPPDTATQPAEVAPPNLGTDTPQPATPREEASQAAADRFDRNDGPAAALEPAPADDTELLTDDAGNVFVVLAEHQGVERPDDAGDDWRPPVILARIDTTGGWSDPVALGLKPYTIPTGKDDD